MKTKCAAHHEGQVKYFEVSRKKSLLDELRRNKIPIPFSCGGEGICTTCKVLILDGQITERTEVEQARADERGYGPEERLSCQCFPCSEKLVLKVP